ncbi:MAG: 3D domain-containing protein, partial [Negativicutes bacterium]|nr:3D domain-containing protein [Negativicutes bacterium]
APGPLDNGKWNNLTYVGGIVQKGVVAVDPKIIPMGTKLWVEGYGQAVAEDQGSAIKGNRIDLAFNDRQEAIDYGIQNVKVYVLN